MRAHRAEKREYSGTSPVLGSRYMGLILWLHSYGATRASRGGISRLTANLSWAAWMTLWFASHAQNHPLRAIGRLWRWQLSRRVFRRPILIELPTGGRLLCPPWSCLGGELVAVGFHWAPETTMFISDLLRPGDIMIDVGANIGAYSVVGLLRGANVVAFEPTARAVSTLVESARINGWGSRVSTHQVALANFDGSARFSTGLDVKDHIIDGGSSGQIVEVRRLDSFLDEHPLPGPIALFKIDVEGTDLQVLHGGRVAIKRDRPCIIVEIWDGGTEIRRFLRDLSYRVYSYNPVNRTLVEVAADFTGQGDFIAVPDSALHGVQIRLRQAQRLPIGPPRIQWSPKLQRSG